MCFELFKLILIGGVGYGTSFYFIFAQLLISMYAEVKFLFAALKSKPLTLKFSVLTIPLVIILTYLMASSIMFGPFLSNWSDESSLYYLVSVTLTEQGVMEIMTFVAVFLILTIIYSTVYRMKLLLWLMTFGIESLAAFALLVLYGGLFFRAFPFTISDLCNRNINLVRYLFYGLFSVIFKDFVLAVCLAYGAVFRERKLKGDTGEELYIDRRRYYKKQSLAYLTQDYLPISLSLILFSFLAGGFLAYLWARSPVGNLEEMPAVIMFVLLFGLLLIMGLFLLYRRIRPQTTTAYRQLCAMGNEDVVFKLFYDEMVKGNPIEHRIRFNETELFSPHFVMRKSGIKTTVEWKEGSVPAGFPLQP